MLRLSARRIVGTLPRALEPLRAAQRSDWDTFLHNNVPFEPFLRHSGVHRQLHASRLLNGIVFTRILLCDYQLSKKNVTFAVV